MPEEKKEEEKTFHKCPVCETDLDTFEGKKGWEDF